MRRSVRSKTRQHTSCAFRGSLDDCSDVLASVWSVQYDTFYPVLFVQYGFMDFIYRAHELIPGQAPFRLYQRVLKTVQKMALPDKVHDPLFHFETHFPERLSRLHLNPELSHHVPVARRIRRSRAHRQGARYKTQPVTFDEIQEVDEDNLKEEDKVDGEKKSGLKGQFMAFSRSMDGLVSKISRIQKDTIPENDVLGGSKDGQNQSEENENKSSSLIDSEPIKESRLEGDEDRKENKENEPSDVQENSNASLPPIGPHAQHRKQRMTAKAKRRHIQSETESQSSCKTEQTT